MGQKSSRPVRRTESGGPAYDTRITSEPDVSTTSTQDSETSQITSQLRNTALSENSNSTSQYLDFPFLTEIPTVEYLNGSKIMFIMRGLPGSGKSVVVKEIQSIYEDVIVCSADDYFARNGKYEFDRSRLKDAHEFCQNKAKEACNANRHTIIIDNTNVKKWEMTHYFRLANDTNYITVLVEPRTPWKFDIEQLAEKNSHQVDIQVLLSRASQWDTVIPMYFGWFLNEADSKVLALIGQALLEECLQIPEFLDDFRTFSGLERVKDILGYYFPPEFTKGGILHCTSKFCRGGKIPGSRRYATSTAITNACGKCYTINIVGIVMTPRALGARVQLDDDQLTLWDNELVDTEVNTFKPAQMNSGRGHNQSFNGSPVRDKEETSRQQYSPHCQASLVLMQQDHTFHPVKGIGSRAHITLGSAEGIAPVTTGLEVLDIVDCEAKQDVNPQHETFSMPRGLLRNYGDGRWCLYMKQKIVVNSLFSGFY